jgi:hypothetical protein
LDFLKVANGGLSEREGGSRHKPKAPAELSRPSARLPAQSRAH